jgi:hypothetical protein
MPREVWDLAVEFVDASVEQVMHVRPPEPGFDSTDLPAGTFRVPQIASAGSSDIDAVARGHVVRLRV